MPPAMRDFGMPLANSFDAIIGVSVSATNAENPTAAATVTPNSPNNRPVSPVMNDTGTNTAISTSVVAMTAKPISREPLIAASTGGLAALDAPHDVLEHDDGVVDDEADREHRAEQRQRVDRVAERGHHDGRGDDRTPGS